MKMVIESNPETDMLGNEDLDMDIISNLPDSILCQILQFLPTKNIIATSILSKRWNNIFPFAYPPINLDLDDSLLLRPVENAPDSPMTSFRDFMDKLLFVTLRNVSGLEGMTLKCTEDYGDKDIVSWVSAALRLNVRNLVLDIFLYKPKTLFSRLNGCTTLVSLELVMSCELLIPDNFSLPSLRRLYLSELGFRDFDGTKSINELISSCPMLEELEMVHCEMGGVFRLSIWSPMLKVLSITKSWIYADETELEIHAPNLERFMFDDYVAGGALFATFNSLFEAYIDVGTINEQVEADDVLDGDWNIYADVVRIIAACSNTKNLYLSEYAILSLHYAPLQLPQFQNLILLVLGSVRSEGWMILAGLLCNAPNLERLTFTEEFKQSETWFADFERLVSTPPVCLERHMKNIDIRDFEGNEDEFKLLNYFLHNAKVLEEVQLGCSTKMNVNARYRLFMMEHNTKIVVVQSANK